MNDPFLVPCLATLRAEFEVVAPHRDRGADGWIGDRAHQQESSDHNPDETGRTPYEDADNVDEVHALDIDCTGPWPGGGGGEAGGWFDRQILRIAEQERVEYQSPTILGRLQNIIWRGRIISRSWGWSEWRPYSGVSKHFDHAHFSARYLSSTEADTRPWGVIEEDIVTRDDIAAIAAAVEGKLVPRLDKLSADQAAANAADVARDATLLLAQRQTAESLVKARAQLESWSADQVAALIPDGVAQQVADILAARLAS